MKPLDLILLVDDDETTNHVNLRTLKRNNLAKDVKIFMNGQDAIDYIKSTTCAPEFPGEEVCPELIFLDIKMPVMDGFDFLEAYRSLGLSDTSITIMMLTSSASFYDLKRLETYGEVKRHFDKPLADQDLKQIIEDYFPERAE